MSRAAVVCLIFLGSFVPQYANADCGDIGSDNMFDLAVGPSENGDLGATLAGDVLDAPCWLAFGTDYRGFFGLTADSKWSSQDGALNQSTVGGQVGMLVFKDWGAFWGAEPAVEIAVDVFQRIGRFQSSEETSQIEEANQTVGGISATVQFPWSYMLANKLTDLSGTTPRTPKLSVSHYWTGSDSRGEPLPDRLAANNLLVSLTADLPFSRAVIGKELQTLRLMLRADATKPTTGRERSWQTFAELKLVLDTGSEVRPALVYVSGDRNGLSYDEQLLLALFWSLGGSSAPGPYVVEPAAEGVRGVQVVDMLER